MPRLTWCPHPPPWTSPRAADHRYVEIYVYGIQTFEGGLEECALDMCAIYTSPLAVPSWSHLNFTTFHAVWRKPHSSFHSVCSNPHSLFSFKYSNQVQASLMRTYCEREKGELVGPDNRCVASSTTRHVPSLTPLLYAEKTSSRVELESLCVTSSVAK